MIFLTSGKKVSYSIQYCHTNLNAEYVILSSGLGGHASFWAPQIDALQSHFHVLSYDQEGCHSDSNLLPEHYSFENLADQVLKILKEQNIQKFHFIGHAIGGFIGAELALLCLSHQLKMLTLTCINAWDQLDPHTHKCFEARVHLLQSAGSEAYVRAQALFLYPPAWISKHHLNILKAENLQLSDFPPLQNVLRRIQAARHFSIKDQHQQALKHVAIHLIANEDDFLVPVQKSHDLKQRLGHGTLTIIANGAHASTVTESKQINQHLLTFYLEHGFCSDVF